VLDLVRRMPGVRAAIPLPFSPHVLHLSQRYALGRSLRGRYADAYVLPGSFISALIPVFARIPRRHGYLRELRVLLINRVTRMPAGAKRRTAAAYLRLTGEEHAKPRPQLVVDPDNQARLLERFGLERGAFAVFVPGAAAGPAKRWPAESFGQLARMLAARGMPVVVLGGPDDRGGNAAIAAAAPGAINLAGGTSLSEAIDLIAAARVAISNDTGPMHTAAAVGVPTIGIYGSTSPDDTPPLADIAAVVTHRLACSPCHARTCPLGHTRCLTGITPMEVMAALDQLRLPLMAPSG
jgi:heptosyltransferase-2